MKKIDSMIYKKKLYIQNFTYYPENVPLYSYVNACVENLQKYFNYFFKSF
jgi:hypothetical protein